MIFAPLSALQLQALLSTGEIGDTPAFTATEALRTDLDLGAGEDEDADFAAFRYATIGAIALARIPHSGADRDPGDQRAGRIVVAAEVPVDQARGNDRLGRVRIARLRRQNVTAVYLDEEAAWPALAAAHKAAGPHQDPEEVGEAPDVRTLLDQHAMLWHLPAEVAD